MNKLSNYTIIFALLISIILFSACGKKEPPVVDQAVSPVRLAVTSEFMPTAKLLADQFTIETAIGVELTGGSDDELSQMILEGTDIDVFMASDTEHPLGLVDEGRAESEGSFVYALGTAALYSRDWKLNWNGVDYLQSGQFIALSIPNSDNRYGAAGVAALKDVGVYDAVQSKLVTTENEAESLELVNTRAANAGFIAFSSISDREKRWAWVVPQSLYDPIEQGAVVISKEPANQSAQIWMGYLASDQARSIIRQSGYGVLGPDEIDSSN